MSEEIKEEIYEECLFEECNDETGGLGGIFRKEGEEETGREAASDPST